MRSRSRLILGGQIQYPEYGDSLCEKKLKFFEKIAINLSRANRPINPKKYFPPRLETKILLKFFTLILCTFELHIQKLGVLTKFS